MTNGTGRALRLRRLLRDGAMVMLPLDHGIGMGPIPGLASPAQALALAAHGATCVALHRGLAHLAAAQAILPPDVGLLLHLSASTPSAPDPDDKRLVATVEDAVRLGADGVSIHVNLGSATEARQVEDAGRVASACDAWGMPLVVMAYPRGPKVTDPRDPELVARAARWAGELGADAVKVPYTGNEASFRRVVEGAATRVIVAGGEKAADWGAYKATLHEARRAGAAGVSVGRNVFQAADGPRAMAELAAIFRAHEPTHPSGPTGGADPPRPTRVEAAR